MDKRSAFMILVSNSALVLFSRLEHFRAACIVPFDRRADNYRRRVIS